MADPYREMDLPPPRHPGPRPFCVCLSNDTNKFSISFLGGWWHTKECIDWWEEMKLYEERLRAYLKERATR